MYGESCNFTAHFLLQFPESLTRRLPDCSYSHTVSKTRILDNGPDRRTHPEPECLTGHFLILYGCWSIALLGIFCAGLIYEMRRFCWCLVTGEWVGWGRLGSSRCMGLIWTEEEHLTWDAYMHCPGSPPLSLIISISTPPAAATNMVDTQMHVTQRILHIIFVSLLRCAGPALC